MEKQVSRHSFGVMTAAIFMGLISLFGLGAILITSGLIFRVIKYLGAAYLVFLGIKMWRNSGSVTKTDNVEENSRTSFYKLYIQALLVGLSNPKAVIFLQRFSLNFSIRIFLVEVSFLF